MKIALAGNKGSFSHEAAQLYLLAHQQANVELIFTIDSAGSFTALYENKADIIIVPIYNTAGGLVKMTLQEMGKYPFTITEWFNLPIQQCLMSLPQTKPAEIKQIVSHSQALMQCRHYLNQHWPKCVTQDYKDTAQAAQDLAENKFSSNTAVIASRLCAELYQLTIIAENIQDQVDNTTMFLVIKQRDNSSRDKLQPASTNLSQNLDQLRKQIDQIDEQIVKSIAERFTIVEQVKKFKQQHQLTVQDANREAELLQRLNSLANHYHVPLDVITHIFDYLMHTSRLQQQE